MPGITDPASVSRGVRQNEDRELEVLRWSPIRLASYRAGRQL